MNQVIVLNQDYSFLNIVSVKRAMSYIAKGKVIVEKYSEKLLTTVDKSFNIPVIVRFKYFIRDIFRRKVPWSKHNIWIRDGYICGYCGVKLTNKTATIDHVIPKDAGGKNTFENTVTSCKSCNNKKGHNLPSQCNMYPSHKLVQPTITEFMRKWNSINGIDKIIQTLWE